MKHRYRLLLIIVIIVLFAMLVSRLPAEQKTTSHLGLFSNRFCQQGDWIYYSSYDAIYKIKTDGQEKTKICDEDTNWIQVDQDCLYYINADHNHYIYSIKTDGSDKTMVSAKSYGGNNAKKLFVADGWIYFTDDRIFKMKTDGTEHTNLVRLCQDMSLSGDWIYYLVPDMDNPGDVYLYRIRTDGTDETKLTELCHIADYDDEWIYYSDMDDSGIYKMKFDGTEKQKLTEDTALYQLKVVNDWIYYLKDGICKVRTNGSENVQVNKDNPMFLVDIWNDHLLYLNIDLIDGNPSMNLSTVTLSESDKTDPVAADIIDSVVTEANNLVTTKTDH